MVLFAEWVVHVIMFHIHEYHENLIYNNADINNCKGNNIIIIDKADMQTYYNDMWDT